MTMRFWFLGAAVSMLVMNAGAVSPPLSILCVGVADRSGVRSVPLTEIALRTLPEVFHQTGAFTVTVVRDPVVEKRLPLNATDLVATGKSANASYVLQGVLSSAAVRKNPEAVVATVAVEVALAAVTAPRLVWKAQASGQGRGESEEVAFSRALQGAWQAVAQQLATAMRLRGQVLLPPAYTFLDSIRTDRRTRFFPRTVRISLDLTAALPVGAEVVVVRGNQPIAAGRVVEVDYGSSLVALTCTQPDTLPNIGDTVAVTYLPPRPLDLPLPLKKEREFRRAEHNFGWAVLIAGVAAAFVGE